MDLTNIGFSVVHDLSAAPKLPDGQTIVGKVYAFNVPETKTFSKGVVSIELADKPASGARIGRFVEKDNSWQMLDSKVVGNKITANSEGNGIFAVLMGKDSTKI